MSETLDTQTIRERVQAIVESIVAGTSVYIVEVAIRGRAGAWIVDVFLESDGVLDVDLLASISRQAGHRLEVEEVIPDRYQLNVSSPGLDRPLALPRQYRKNIGRPLNVKVQADEGIQTLTGELVEVGDHEITLAGPDGERHTIAFDRIITAKVQLPW